MENFLKKCNESASPTKLNKKGMGAASASEPQPQRHAVALEESGMIAGRKGGKKRKLIKKKSISKKKPIAKKTGVYRSKGGYFYRRYKNGKVKRISKETYKK